MSDDSFIREVNEELRQDQLKAIWDRFGTLIITVVVVVVAATAAWRGYVWYVESKANASGDRFLAALTMAQEGKSDDAMKALEALEADGYGSYPLLARMRAATLLAQDGKVDDAVASFDAVAADTGVPQSIRDMAALRAAFLLVDHGSYEDVARRAEPLSADSNDLRHSAREALGLSAWKKGDAADALKLFQQIAADQQAPGNLRQRAQMMSELIAGSGETS
ncbi:hypothetical protein CSC94_10960 [Zhengella mangrovi]|uniref:Ancillary SecYEG translocon subunit/Cell division coordinator CpoB TPR domain-containing protein n=1 Tax=Zhengella mangrovi TaxID=1982044 RepID=A0A2G1QNL9_9HYPH|nr:tetratricopeptide repeat protein [Zhengella mangrovi]PHP67064.1 hypothetical protein CSC94_10960 [Zhengella mangrovi]